jgi:membrane protease YdiL (CAAX protease family)
MQGGVWAIIYSTIILLLFILVIDLTKKLFRQKYLIDKADTAKTRIFWQKYYIEEFKPIFFSTLLFVILLIIGLNFVSDYVGFNINQFLFYEMSFMNILRGSIFILLLNGVLYLGLIVQLVKGYEFLNLENKNWILLVKENLYGPILEEILYRGIIFNILVSYEYSNFNSAAISSVMFGICKNMNKIKKILKLIF